MKNRVVIHSRNLGDKSDFKSFKILQSKCKTLSRNNATLPDESCSKIVTGLEGSKAPFRVGLEVTPVTSLSLSWVLIFLSSSVPGTCGLQSPDACGDRLQYYQLESLWNSLVEADGPTFFCQLNT